MTHQPGPYPITTGGTISFADQTRVITFTVTGADSADTEHGVSAGCWPGGSQISGLSFTFDVQALGSQGGG